MKQQIRKWTAMLLSIIMLLSMMPLDVLADTLSSAWFDPVSGKELEVAETSQTDDSQSVVLYVGEKWSIPVPGYSPIMGPDTKIINYEIKDNTLSVTGLKEGYTTISYYTNGVKTWYVFTVIQPGISLDKTDYTGVVGNTVQLTATVVKKKTENIPAGSSTE